MNGFFARMGERAVGRPAALRVRPPQVFEAQRPAPPARADALGVPAESADLLGLDVETVLDVARDLLPQPAAGPGAPRRPDRVVHLPATASLPTEATDVPTTQVPGPAEQHRLTPTPAEPSGPDERRTTSAATAAAATAPPRRPGDASRRRPTSAAHDPTPVPPDGPAGRREAPAPKDTPVFAGLTGPLVELPSVTAPDLGDLLRRHVLPELVARGLAGPHERVEVVTDTAALRRDAAPSAARRARPGTETVSLTASPPHYTTTAPGEEGPGRAAVRRAAVPPAAQPPGATPAPPQVQVHIGQVVVTRPTPAPRPAPPSPVPRNRPQPDHESYLTRRREGR